MLIKYSIQKNLLIVQAIVLLVVACTAHTKKADTSQITRIISAAPSNTEIIVDLGLADKLVAIDSYSADIAGISNDIPRIDFAYPDVELLFALKPDIIIVTGLNRTGTGDDPFALLRESGIQVVYISTSASIDGIYQDIVIISEVLGVAEEGQKLIQHLKSQVDTIAQNIAAIEQKRTVYFEVSPAPQLVSFGRDTFLHSMIECIGAENIFADEKGWLAPNAEAIIAKNPDVILTNVNYIDDPLDEIKTRPGFEYISAVRNGEVYYIDNNSSSRPSSRIILALEQMAEAVYGRSFSHEATQ
jgi:iron complex transport system substrate-binding protein